MINDECNKSVNTPNFKNLSYGTLRRYQAFFNLRKDDGTTGIEKEEILKMITEHFMNFELENDKVIENFVKIEKDLNNEKNNSLRKSIRFQEKNMAKFLDNFSTFK